MRHLALQRSADSQMQVHYLNATAAAPGSGIAEAAAACLVAGETCLDHCLNFLSKGDTSIAACSQRVNEMLGEMTGLLKLSSSGSTRLAAFAAVAKDVCRDCEAECRKHQDHHPLCRACAEACARTIAALSRA